MPDQTQGSASGKAHEPSMEDILASIRRMISDDDVSAVETGDVSQAEAESPQSLEPSSLVKSVEVKAVEEAPTPTAPPSAPTTPEAMSAFSDHDLTFESFETDFDLESDLTIPEISLSPEPEIEAADKASEPNQAEYVARLGEDEDADLIDIDELIAEVESRVEADVTEAVEADMSGERRVADNTDIELVKSLMADLTDDTAEEDLTDVPSDDELTQILDEISDIQVSDDLAVEIDMDGAPDDDFNALLQIAQSAKADASAIALGASGAAIAGASIITETVITEPEAIEVEEEPDAAFETEFDSELDADPEIEIETHLTEPHIEETEFVQETPKMADTADETIMDADVEEATTSAFASLAKVVERKDDVVTSGPAIGDLVKEALNPMLKEWLDKNLKGIVERAVAKEIKRIANTK